MKVAFFGTPAFALPTLDAIHESHHELVLVVAQPDRPAGRGMKMTRPPVASRAIELGLPLAQPASVRKPEIHERLRESEALIAVVVAYGRILPRSLLDVPRHGFINVHASLLPLYRGAAPIQRAIEAGETVTGVSVMQVDEELDHGPVLRRAQSEIGPDETSAELFSRLAELGGEVIVPALDEIEAGTAVWTEQEHDAATLAPMISKEEGDTNFDEPSRRLYDRFRAFQPWPGITADILGERVRLRALAPSDLDSGDETPGTVLGVGSGSLVVACREGSIAIREAQRPGKKPVSGEDLARGFRLGPGDQLSRDER